MKCEARLIGVTKPVGELSSLTPEGLIAYAARVSSDNQDNPEYMGLLSYCIRNKHWSIFQMVNVVVEIEAPRDITRQFTRHSSMYTPGDPFEAPGFNFEYGGVQEFSQRYSDKIELTTRDARRQDDKNRQNSIDDLPEESKELFGSLVKEMTAGYNGGGMSDLYQTVREAGVAKECARVFLPEGLTMSRLYVNGTLRSWLHYLEVRTGNGTQKEHVLLAEKIREVIAPTFPTIFGIKADV